MRINCHILEELNGLASQVGIDIDNASKKLELSELIMTKTPIISHRILA